MSEADIQIIIMGLTTLVLVVGILLWLRGRHRLKAAEKASLRTVSRFETEAIKTTLARALSAPNTFRRRAAEQWEHLEKTGPLSIAPTKKGFAPQFWKGTSNIYGLLYPKHAFKDITHYFLFTWYASSIQQFVAEGEPFELSDWFIPGKKETQIEALSAYLHKLPPVTDTEEARQLIESWELPPSFHWMHNLDFLAVWIKGREDEMEMTAVCREGYLSFFALHV